VGTVLKGVFRPAEGATSREGVSRSATRITVGEKGYLKAKVEAYYSRGHLHVDMMMDKGQRVSPSPVVAQRARSHRRLGDNTGRIQGIGLPDAAERPGERAEVE
jgi:hypothetical protein